MKNLIINQIYFCMKKKHLYLLAFVLLVISLQIYSVYSTSNIESIEINAMDAILNVCGGVDKTFSLTKLAGWLILTIALLMITQSATCIMGGFDLLLLTKSQSKAKWWLSKVISLIIITLGYSLFILLSSKVICSVLFRNSKIWSNYTNIYYPNIYNSTVHPTQIQFIIIVVFCTGFIASTTLFQTLNVLLNNSVKSYISILMLYIILNILYNNGIVSRILSPVNYPSVLDMDCNVWIYVKNIILNIFICVVNIIVCFAIVIKRDYVSFEN